MEENRLNCLLENLFEFIPAFHKTLGVLNRESRKNGRSGKNMEILYMLQRKGSMPTSIIGKNLGLSAPHISIVLDQLIEEGLIDRMHDIEDRRIVRIQLTKKGILAVDERSQELRERMQESLEGISKADTTRYLNAITTMNELFIRLQNGSEIK